MTRFYFILYNLVKGDNDMYCYYCGTKLNIKYKFCPTCGKKLYDYFLEPPCQVAPKSTPLSKNIFGFISYLIATFSLFLLPFAYLSNNYTLSVLQSVAGIVLAIIGFKKRRVCYNNAFAIIGLVANITLLHCYLFC